MNGLFEPTYSTNNIWWDEEFDQCLTLHLEAMKADIDDKVDATHTHTGYAQTDHTHSGYANATHSHSEYASLAHEHTGYADSSHSHSEYAALSHEHSGYATSNHTHAGFATESYVDTAISCLVDSSPDALNTLNELAAALGDDPNFATTIATQVGGKVDKVDGKELSSNDYTDAEKTKLAGIAAGANKYTLPIATSSVLGGVKVGSNITNSSGTISLSKGNVTSALGYTPFDSSSVLPLANGGTGQTKAWTNGTVSSLNGTTITSAQFAVFPYLNKAFIRLNVLLGSSLAAGSAAYIAMPSTVSTAHTALSCYNHSSYDIHCGMSSDSGIYVINCGTSNMSNNVRLYISGWFSI